MAVKTELQTELIKILKIQITLKMDGLNIKIVYKRIYNVGDKYKTVIQKYIKIYIAL